MTESLTPQQQFDLIFDDVKRCEAIKLFVMCEPLKTLHPMASYYRLLAFVRFAGQFKPASRTSQHTLSKHGQSIFYRRNGFPADTARPVAVKGAIGEMLAFINGATSLAEFHEHGCHFWDSWADENGNLGPIYGAAWNDRELGINQLNRVVEQIKKAPYSRRHHVSAWKLGLLPDEGMSPQENAKNGKMALAPCHMDFTFEVRPINARHPVIVAETLLGMDEVAKLAAERPKHPDGTPFELDRGNILDLTVHMRANDLGPGQPHNAIGYYALLAIVAKLTHMHVGNLTFYIDDAHIYLDQLPAVDEHIQRAIQEVNTWNETKPSERPHQVLAIKGAQSFTELSQFRKDNFQVVNYQPQQPPIKYPVCV